MHSITTRLASAIKDSNRRDRGERGEQPVWLLLGVFCVLCGCLGVPARAQEPPRPVPTPVWSPKPAQTPAYPPGQNVWTRLADLKAAHHGEAGWRVLLVDDGRLTGEYVAAAPGTKVARRLHPDTREWFAVVEGEVRVEIEGQAPLTATRGSVVNIPRQTIYSVETIGDKPSLRFLDNVARAKTLFPRSRTCSPHKAQQIEPLTKVRRQSVFGLALNADPLS